LPWKHDGEYVLLAGQVFDDKSLETMGNPASFYQRTYDELIALNIGTIVYRRHPQDRHRFAPKGGLIDAEPSLAKSLSKATGLFTFNSNASVDAVLSGIPTCVCDIGSMTWTVSAHWQRLPFEFIRPDRTQWLRDLSYCQWTADEIESGLAWEHLKPIAEELLRNRSPAIKTRMRPSSIRISRRQFGRK
jgi:hypothetical protein